MSHNSSSCRASLRRATGLRRFGSLCYRVGKGTANPRIGGDLVFWTRFRQTVGHTDFDAFAAGSQGALGGAKLNSCTSWSLQTTFAALADPTRRAILARLSSGERSVTELAAPFALSLPAVSKHLKVLERAGLIARRREAQWRPCRLEAGPLKDVADWLEEYRRFWEERFDRLDDYLREIQREEERNDRNRTEEEQHDRNE